MGRGNTLPPPLPASGRQDMSGRRGRSGIQMGRVASILEEAGLDPTKELAAILQPVPMLDQDGRPKVDAEGRPVLVHRLDDKTRAQVFLALHDFVAPRLKSVEVKVDTTQDLTDEQLQARIQALLAAERDAE